MRFFTRDDQVYAIKSLNARVSPPPPERYVAKVPPPKQRARLGIGHAVALVRLELGAMRWMDSFDSEWYEGEVLRRVRARLLADPIVESSFRDADHRRSFEYYLNWLLNTYQFDSVDLDAVRWIGKRRYYTLLFDVLNTIYEEEGIEGEITALVLSRYRFGRSERDRLKRAGRIGAAALHSST